MHAFIYIIESPSASDLYDGRTEGRALCEALKLAGIPHEYTVAVNLEKFAEALAWRDGSRLFNAALKHNAYPVVHLSMHGDGEGVSLTDGTSLQWWQLQRILHPINESIHHGLMVTFSTCRGASAMRMSMHLDDTKPFYATVGSFEEVRWDEALVAFLVFFHNWFQGCAPDRAAELMRLATGHSGFEFTAGPAAKASYQQFIYSQRLFTAPTSPMPGSGLSLFEQLLGSGVLPPASADGGSRTG